MSIDKIMKYTKEDSNAMKYLPTPKDIKKLPREYLLNLIYSALGEDFKNWINQNCSARNQK